MKERWAKMLLLGGGVAPCGVNEGIHAYDREFEEATYAFLVRPRRGTIFVVHDGLDYVNPRDRRGGCYSKTRSLPPRDQVDTAKAFLAACCKRTSTVRRKHSSYRWKHEAERWGHNNKLSSYVSNGALIQAAAELNCDIRPTEPGSINAWISIAYAVRPVKISAHTVRTAAGSEYVGGW